MLSKEEIENVEHAIKNFNGKLADCLATGKMLVEYKQLLAKEQKLIEINDKYLQKLVYALTPTTHELSTDNNNAFKKIIADNIDLETCKIRRKLKEFWGVDKY